MHALLPVCCPYSVVGDCCESQEQNVNQKLVAIFGLVLLVQGGHHYCALQVRATIVRQIQLWPTHSAVPLCSACIVQYSSTDVFAVCKLSCLVTPCQLHWTRQLVVLPAHVVQVATVCRPIPIALDLVTISPCDVVLAHWGTAVSWMM